MVKRAASLAIRAMPEIGEWAGLVAVAAGVWQLSHAAAWIVAGVLVVVKANLTGGSDA